MSTYYAPPPTYVQANPKYNYNPNIYQSTQHYPPPHYPHYPHYHPPPPQNPYVQQPVYHYPIPYHQHYQHHPPGYPQNRNSVINPQQKLQSRLSSTTTTTTTTPFNDVDLNYIGEKLTALIEDNGVQKPQFELEEIPSAIQNTNNSSTTNQSTTTQTNAQTSQDNLNQIDNNNTQTQSSQSSPSSDSNPTTPAEPIPPTQDTPQTNVQTSNPSSSLTTSTTPSGSPTTTPVQGRNQTSVYGAPATNKIMYKNTPSAGISFPRGRNKGHLRTGSADVRTQTQTSSHDSSNIAGPHTSNVQLPPNPMSRHKRNASDGNPARKSFAPFRRTPPVSRNHSRTPSVAPNSSLPVEEKEVLVECTVCLTESPQSEFYTLSCGHSFCMSCTKQHFGVLISSGVTRILCLQGGCGKEVSVEDIACVVDSSLIEKLLKFEKKKLLAGKKNARYCPAVDCGQPVLGDGENKMLTCECGKVFCFDCGENWHEGLTCKQSRKLQKKGGNKETNEKKAAKWKRKHTKPCPRCGISIQKTAGCEFMQCSGCDFQFCWKCLEPHDHFMTTHKHGPHGRKKRIAKKIAYGSAVAVGVAVVAVPAILLGGIAIPALVIGGSIIAAARDRND